MIPLRAVSVASKPAFKIDDLPWSARKDRRYGSSHQAGCEDCTESRSVAGLFCNPLHGQYGSTRYRLARRLTIRFLLGPKKLSIQAKFRRVVAIRLMRRCGLYLLAIILVLTLTSFWKQPDVSVLTHLIDNFKYLLPMLAAGAAIVPWIIYDFLKATNKMAGPVQRCQQAIRKLASNEDTLPLQFRSRDHWSDLAEDFNALAERITEERQQALTEADVCQQVFSIN